MYIQTQTHNATRNMSEFYRFKFSMQTELISFSQKCPINILKPLLIGRDIRRIVNGRVGLPKNKGVLTMC